MNTAQITQSLRAQLAANGISGRQINQLMGSGASFMDIIQLMLMNTQTGADLQAGDYSEIISTLTENLMGSQQYFPVVPEENMMEMQNQSDEERFDFSDSLISADPLQLSGLLGFISTGSNITPNDEIINTLYSELPINTQEFVNTKVNAYDLVNQYLESGELEIVGYTPVNNIDAQNQANAENGQSEDDIMGFFRTLKSAKEGVSATEETVDPATISSLQNSAENLDIRFDRISSEIKMFEEFESPENQLLKGVADNLKQGNSEFTVKLKPEGLGEIIVKLIQNDGGKMLMSMTASNAGTAELLNSNLAALQGSLNQHNVEIVNPTDMTNTIAAMTPAFEQYYGQNEGGFNQQNQQFYYNPKQGYSRYAENGDDEAFEAIATAPVGQSELNILI